MLAVRFDAAGGRFLLVEAAEPAALPHQALVAVQAFSLNAGEVRNAAASSGTDRIGWDFAGVVLQAAANGTGPREGARVVGLSLAAQAWAHRVAVPADALAELAPGVSCTPAATLPVAGLTALLSLAKAGDLLGRSVLVTGASGGVGGFACELALLAGARTTAVVRRAPAAAALRERGVHHVVVGDAPDAGRGGAQRYDFILETQGGASLAASMVSLQAGGMCVVCGNTSAAPAQVDVKAFYRQGRVSLHGFQLHAEVARQPAADGLARLAALLEQGRLAPEIGLTASWRRIDEIARAFLARSIAGKAVLEVD